MQALAEASRAALEGIAANRTRSLLTITGIVIGVAAVIAIVSIVQGLSAAVTQGFRALGSNTLTIRSDTPFEQQLQGRVNRLTLGDYQRLGREIGSRGELTPSFSPFGVFGTTVRAKGRAAFTRVTAVSPNYAEVFQVFPARGRFFTTGDDRSRRKVVVIGERLRENLGLPANPIGHFVTVSGEWFRIVGVAEPRGDTLGFNQDDFLLMPFGTGEAIAGSNVNQDIGITVNLADADDIEAVQDRAEQILRRSHGLKPGAEDDFKVQTAKQLTKSFQSIANVVTMGAAGMVGISVIVGGIGIMNMMLVSVTERTREIGICKALGAQRHQILLQFLLESVFLSLFGGLLGVASGFVLAAAVTILLPAMPPTVVPLWTVVSSIAFATLIGVVFGVLPAANASNLSPMEALRHA